jgi:hypothetical protein
MAKPKPNDLSALLAASFAPPSEPEVIIEPTPEPPKEEEPKQPQKAKAALPLPSEYESLRKTTVTFQAEDQRLIDAILDILKNTTRHRGGYSDAVKIALRLCPLDPWKISKAFDAIRAADKRTRDKKVV